MTLDVPNAFIQTGMQPKARGDCIIMKIRGVLVDWLLEIDPLTYSSYVVIKRGEKVLYLEILCAIYGMLEASLLWYRKFRKELEEIGFKFNDYDACVANRMVNNKQHTIRFHVDDVVSSYIDPRVNDEFGEWAQQKYGDLKPVMIVRDKVHEFLGMTLDFSVPGEVHVKQDEHVRDIINSWPEDLSGKTALTPASNDLYKRGHGRLLSIEKK